MENKRVLYTGVVLDEKSRQYLFERFSTLISGTNWKFIAHHMTINLGVAKKPEDLGKKVTLTAIGFGTSSKAIAVRVSGWETKNEIPHVTIAINTENGAKPYDSNLIKNWHEYNDPYTLTGVVTEVTE